MEGLIPDGARIGVVVVAHPDDEALWCGGLIARRSIAWTVICCSIPHHDPERAWLFYKSCARLGCDGRVLPFSEILPLRFDLLPDLAGFDVILTHGAAGEYGHRQHFEVHDFVAKRWPEKSRFFGYREGGAGRFKVPLTDFEKELKLDALQAYDHCAPTDRGKPKWRALLDVYEPKFDLWTETYD